MELQMDQLTMEQRILVHKVLALQDELKRGDAKFSALKYLIDHELSKPLTLVDRVEFNWQKRFKNAQLLHQNYVVARLSALEIAEKFSCSKSTILKYLKFNNIPIREACVAITKNKNLRYGERNRGRQRHRHQREQEVIQKMISFREKGYSYRKIAEILDTMKIPTKTRKTKWQARVVQEVLKRTIKV